MKPVVGEVYVHRRDIVIRVIDSRSATTPSPNADELSAYCEVVLDPLGRHEPGYRDWWFLLPQYWKRKER